MKKTIITLALALAAAAAGPDAAAQMSAGRPSGLNILEGLTGTRKQTVNEPRQFIPSDRSRAVRAADESRELRTSDVWTSDTLCYELVERRNSWVEGIGRPVPADSLEHVGPYFRLTRRNPSGHFLRVELMNAAGMSAPKFMWNYFAVVRDRYDFDPERLEALAEWLLASREVVRLDFVPSADGKRVHMEAAYLPDGTLLHSMMIERVDARRAACFVFDSMGQAVKLTDERYAGPTGLLVKYDTDGSFESITPIDATGTPIEKL